MKIALTSDTHFGLDGKTQGKHKKFWSKLATKIKNEDIKLLIWAGDLACNKQRQILSSMQQMRNYIDIPVVYIPGNHDYWDDSESKYHVLLKRSPNKIKDLHKTFCKDTNIHYLEENPLVLDDVIFQGFMGWYGYGDPRSNDEYHMPHDVEGMPIHAYMDSQSYKKFDELLQVDRSKYRKSVIVTHFPPYVDDEKWRKFCANERYYGIIKDNFDVLCCGHSHQFKDLQDEGLRVLNSGSDYNDPKYLIFEV